MLRLVSSCLSLFLSEDLLFHGFIIIWYGMARAYLVNYLDSELASIFGVLSSMVMIYCMVLQRASFFFIMYRTCTTASTYSIEDFTLN